MREELQKQIEADFPFMKRGASLEEQEANGRIDDLYGAFGMEVGNGWYELIYGLCEEIDGIYKKAGKSVDIKPAQVKEKFGRLRFYYDVIGREKSIHAIDLLGEGGVRFTDQDSELHKEVSRTVRRWEKKSETVCEECGKEAVLRTDLAWVLTLCDDCYKARLEAIANRANKSPRQHL